MFQLPISGKVSSYLWVVLVRGVFRVILIGVGILKDLAVLRAQVLVLVTMSATTDHHAKVLHIRQASLRVAFGLYIWVNGLKTSRIP